MSKRIISPAEELLTSLNAPQEEEPVTPKKAPKKKSTGSGAKKPAKKENRTRRVQLVLTPTLYEQLNDRAWSDRQSVNETIIQAIEEYLKRR